jgi:hypothetical protein
MRQDCKYAENQQENIHDTAAQVLFPETLTETR